MNIIIVNSYDKLIKLSCQVTKGRHHIDKNLFPFIVGFLGTNLSKIGYTISPFQII